MIILKLGALLAVLSDTSVHGILLETYKGVTTFVTPSHVFLNNQSDYFFFEVMSCGIVNVTLLDEIATYSVKLELSEHANKSTPYACYRESCSSSAEISFSAGDYCSGYKAFWIKRSFLQTIPKMFFGDGCTVETGGLTGFYVEGMESLFNNPPFAKMELSSARTAMWKLGSSVCQPATTTVAPTTTSLVPCPSGKNGGSSTSVLSLTTTLLIYMSASL
ncbi:uncharacterized protein LOC124146851 [Haliotis rufescens]|uniref:uncharacterized protein LOC124146851 n=1 Tax=Haliotis rufescens TaxID=6454 RepID=UPI001EAFAC3C|nr:uncharacterized protein LOC124146851 [Haliotis rufescens]